MVAPPTNRTLYIAHLRVLAETARAASMVATDMLEAERLKARADALHEAAALAKQMVPADNVVPFRAR